MYFSVNVLGTLEEIYLTSVDAMKNGIIMDSLLANKLLYLANQTGQKSPFHYRNTGFFSSSLLEERTLTTPMELINVLATAERKRFQSKLCFSN